MCFLPPLNIVPEETIRAQLEAGQVPQPPPCCRYMDPGGNGWTEMFISQYHDKRALIVSMECIFTLDGTQFVFFPYTETNVFLKCELKGADITML